MNTENILRSRGGISRNKKKVSKKMNEISKVRDGEPV
jgi:hypothetical protein